MAVPVSTVPAAKLAIYNGIVAALASLNPPDTTTLVSYDGPGTELPDDIVDVGRVEREVSVAAMVGGGGAGWLDERYHVEVTVSCYRGGEDAAGVEARAWKLVALVESFVRSDPSLGGVVLKAQPTRFLQEGSWESSHKGRVCEVKGFVECRARI